MTGRAHFSFQIIFTNLNLDAQCFNMVCEHACTVTNLNYANMDINAMLGGHLKRKNHVDE